jgi:hypothetical protein
MGAESISANACQPNKKSKQIWEKKLDPTIAKPEKRRFKI